MYFVGRERETRGIKRALEEENNVIVSGRFGEGTPGPHECKNRMTFYRDINSGGNK